MRMAREGEGGWRVFAASERERARGCGGAGLSLTRLSLARVPVLLEHLTGA